MGVGAEEEHGFTLNIGVTNTGGSFAGAHSLIAFVDPPNTISLPSTTTSTAATSNTSSSSTSSPSGLWGPDPRYPRTSLRAIAKTKGALAPAADNQPPASSTAATSSTTTTGERQVLSLHLRCRDFWDWREDAVVGGAISDDEDGSTATTATTAKARRGQRSTANTGTRVVTSNGHAEDLTTTTTTTVMKGGFAPPQGERLTGAWSVRLGRQQEVGGEETAGAVLPVFLKFTD
jgi:hypothetical protein